MSILRKILPVVLACAAVSPLVASGQTIGSNCVDTSAFRSLGRARVYATREGLVGGMTTSEHIIIPNDHFVALPSYRYVSSNGGREYLVALRYGGRAVVVPVWDVGPINHHDDYWNDAATRFEFQSLPQGYPEAEAAWCSGFNNALSDKNLTPSTQAAIDLADGVFRLDLALPDNVYIDVEFLWMTDVAPFVAGDRVRPKTTSKIRATPAGTSSYTQLTAVGGVVSGIRTGKLLGTPGSEDERFHQWVFVTWDDGRSGWSAEDELTFAAGSSAVQPPRNLWQVHAAGETPLVTGVANVEANPLIEAVLADDAGVGARLEVEMRPLASAFTGTATQSILPTDPTALVRLPLTALGNAAYHWRARVVAADGRSSRWVSYGNNDEITADFTVGAPTSTTFVATPSNVRAAAASTSSITTTWSAAAGAAKYALLRADHGSTFSEIAQTAALSFTNTALTPNTGYVYAVQSIAADGTRSPLSAPDFATTIVFTDDPLLARTTVIRRLHVTELQSAINLARAAAGLPPTTFPPPTALVSAADIQALRTSLAAAWSARGVTLTFSEPLVAGVTPIRAVHLQELRDLVR
jgi:hypothetical protein